MGLNAPPPPQVDFAVVGGGILGLAVAREILRRNPGVTLTVLEAEDHIASHQTSHSSGVIHAGVYYEPGSLRAKLCVEGAAELTAYCDEKSVPWSANGKLIVATSEEELERLDRLEARAKENGVAGLERLSADGIPSFEPNARGLSALHSPTTAVVDFGLVATAFAEDVEVAGGSIHLGARVLDLKPSSTGLGLQTATGSLRAGRVVFCGGLQSDRLARMAGGEVEPRIVPIRGGYLRVKADRQDLVKGNLYPVPDPELPFLGAHFTRGIDGSLLIGPTAMLAGARDAYRLSKVRAGDLRDTLAWSGTWRLVRRHPRAAVTEIHHSVSARSLVKSAQRLLPGLRLHDVEPGPAGVRAQALGRDGTLIEDFLVEKTAGAVHVRNAPSPAATSSLALARLVVDELDA